MCVFFLRYGQKYWRCKILHASLSAIPDVMKILCRPALHVLFDALYSAPPSKLQSPTSCIHLWKCPKILRTLWNIFRCEIYDLDLTAGIRLLHLYHVHCSNRIQNARRQVFCKYWKNFGQNYCVTMHIQTGWEMLKRCMIATLPVK